MAQRFIYVFIIYSLSNLFIPKHVNSSIHSPTFEHVFIPSVHLFITSLFAHLLPVVIYLLSLYLLILCVPYIRGIYEPIHLRKANSAIASVL